MPEGAMPPTDFVTVAGDTLPKEELTRSKSLCARFKVSGSGAAPERSTSGCTVEGEPGLALGGGSPSSVYSHAARAASNATTAIARPHTAMGKA